MKRTALAFTAFLMLSAGFTGGVWWFAYSSALDQLAERGRSDLSLAADRLVSQLQQFRELAVLMADHPTLIEALEGGADLAAAEAVLLRAADKTGTLSLHVVGATGRVLASSSPGRLGSDRSAMPSWRRAMQGALGAHHALLPGGAGRSFTFSAPVFGGNDRVIGAVDLDLDIWDVEEVWLGDPQAVFFTDAAGVVFVSNRSELLFRQRGGAGVPPSLFGYAAERLPDFPHFTARQSAGQDIWRIDGGPYLPGRALHLTQVLPVIEMTGEILLDIAPAERIAGLQATVAAALSLIFGATLLLLSQRRRALSDRLELEEAAKASLETRVAQRTAELSAANRALRREVAERLEAEAALKRAQEELVQAGKLSALGQLSAGLSHELNQPLMAIRSFAENGALFLERGEPERAAQNFTRISELGRRMGRIIKNLRAFARQESEPMTDVDMTAVISAVLEMAEARIAQSGVTVERHLPNHPVLVRGGEVRLQQVVLNLVTNAIDAMADSPERRLCLDLEEAGEVTLLHVRDTGPGIAEPEKIFDPFYSTKEVGQSEGMGLGLSISYGLVQSFGGAIRGRNHPEGGAVFTVELARAGQGEEAAA